MGEEIKYPMRDPKSMLLFFFPLVYLRPHTSYNVFFDKCKIGIIFPGFPRSLSNS